MPTSFMQCDIIDSEDLDFSPKYYHPKTSLRIHLWHIGSIG